jgi:hypothetical protein
VLAKKRTINRSSSRILPLPEESGEKKKKKEKRSDVNEYTKEKNYEWVDVIDIIELKNVFLSY